jgi:polyphosphate kinase
MADPLLAEQVVDLLELQLQDTVKGRVLGPEGSVLQRGLDPAGPPLLSQQRTYEHGLLRSGATAVTQRLAEL